MLKKIICLLLICMFIMSGCQNKDSSSETNTNNYISENQNIGDSYIDGSSLVKPSIETSINQNVTLTCAELDCDRRCDNGYTYCSFHKCMALHCDLKQKDNKSSFCINHSCMLCNKQRYPNSNYCISHK